MASSLTSSAASAVVVNLALTIALASLGVGCGAGAEDTTTGGADGAGANGDGAGTTSFNQGGEGAGFNEGASSQGGGCAGELHNAEKVPLDMYIMLDQSGSMQDPPASGSGTRWDAVVAALTAFVNQGESAGIGVGIQYFPLSDGGPTCNVVNCSSDDQCGVGCGPCMMAFPGFGFCQGIGAGDSCDAMDYATPDVEIAPLPGNAAAIVTSMGSHGPTGGTPTSAALQGAVDHATTWANSHPGHAVIVVLATDGDPSGCDENLANINAIAAAGANGTPPILTFVIGVGGSVAALNGFAAAGGTTQAFMIDQDPNAEQAFLAALNAIQGQAIPCAYLIPEPDGGETINFNEINVYYTPSGGVEAVIPRVDSAADCPPSGLAWYYDDPAAPTQILLCGDTCATISADTGGEVKIVVGCETIAE